MACCDADTCRHVPADDAAAEQGRVGRPLCAAGAQPPRGAARPSPRCSSTSAGRTRSTSRALRRLVRSINRCLGEERRPTDGGCRRGAQRRAVAPAGHGLLARRAVAQRSRIDQALGGVLGRRRFSIDMERVLFALVCNRAIDPLLQAGGVVLGDQGRRDLRARQMDEDQAYRAMDLLVERRCRGRGPRGGLLLGGQPVEPRSRPAVLRHHLDVLRDRRRRRRRWRASGSSGTRRITAPTCPRS